MQIDIEGYVASLGLKKSKGQQLVNFLKEQDKQLKEANERIAELENGIKWVCENAQSVFVFTELKKLLHYENN